MDKRKILKDILRGKAAISQLLRSRKARTFNLVNGQYKCNNTGEVFTLHQLEAMNAPYERNTARTTMYAIIDDLDGHNDQPFYVNLPAIEL